MAEHAIEVSGIWKKFRRGQLHDSLRDLIPAIARRLHRKSPENADLSVDTFWALRDVSFHLDRGDALGIIGSNGAGKSTMLKVLARILKPNMGRIKVNGRLNALIEVAAGFHADLTGRENVYLNGAILGMKKREVDRKLDQIIEFSGVEPFIDTPVKRYSSGMQARLGFSVAAHLDPDILLVDEVLSVGDMQFQNRCVATMNDKLKNGATIIFVSHNLPAVAGLCPKTLVLHHGETAFLGETQEGISRYMELAYSTKNEYADAPVALTQASWNASGNDFIRPADSFELKIGLRFLQQVAHPGFELVIKRMNDALTLYCATSQELGLSPRNYEEGEEILLSFKGRINLLRGLYVVGVKVTLPSQDTEILYLKSLYQFYVHETVSFSGMVDLNCTASESQIKESIETAPPKM
ncbi:MAG: ABC transporter ATP-binding protein [Syntrophobacteraceae bacterium]|jgi:lipopolysaccharide transport system ATP-binding protein